MKLFYISFFSFIALYSNGQNALTENPFENPIILKHYTVQDLQSLQQTDTLKFNKIRYYYTKSFIFERQDCHNCDPVTITTFDVSQYEYLRQKDKRYIRSFSKYGFKLTLLSIDELQYKLPIHYTK